VALTKIITDVIDDSIRIGSGSLATISGSSASTGSFGRVIVAEMGNSDLTSVSSSISTRITTNSGSFAAASSSYSSASGSLSTRVNLLEGSGSINDLVTDSGSFSTRVNLLEGSGSIFESSASFSTRVNLLEGSGSIFESSASFSTRVNLLEGSGSITESSASFSTRVSDLKTDSGSFSTRVTTAEASGALFDGDGEVTFAGATITGTLTAQEVHTEFISASVTVSTGSNIFGDETGDVHQFTGSIETSGSIILDTLGGNVSGSIVSTGSFGAANIAGMTVSNLVDVSSSISTRVSDLVTDSGSFSTRVSDLNLSLSGSTALISGSSVSTGSFGGLYVGGGTHFPGGGISFGDGDSGIFESGDDSLRVRSGGNNIFLFNSTSMTGDATGAPRLLSAAGAAATPVYTFNDDPNTGMFRTAADSLGFSTNGVQRLIIDSAGFFDVTATGNDIARFSGANSGGLTIRNDSANQVIIHTATSDDLVFGTGGNNDRVTIDASGDVGIGTTVPAYTLDILNSTTPQLNISNTASDDTAKFSQITTAHYHNSEEPMTMMEGRSDGSNNYVRLGGGRSEGNAMQILEWYFGSNDATTGGTKLNSFDDSTALFLQPLISGSSTSTGSFGNVRIGDIGRSGRFYIAGDGIPYDSSAEYITIESEGDRSIDIRSQGQIRFYVNNANTLAATIEADGDMITKRIFPVTDGAHDLGDNTKSWRKVYTDNILFNGDTADANALDDYEEGTWTGEISTTGTGFTTSGTGSDSKYTKIGNKVTAWFSVSINSPTGGSGTLKLAGLPFTSSDSNTSYRTGMIDWGRTDNVATLQVLGILASDSAVITFTSLRDADTSLAFPASNMNGQTTPFFTGRITYTV